ncbi:MAG: hypothetical protein IJN03_00060 [Bacilli bacterium]|nr:hypothetical protein [Bacilli bacterium]
MNNNRSLINLLEQINTKIENNNFNFTELEVKFISLNKNLYEKIFNILANNREEWKTLSKAAEKLLDLFAYNYELNEDYIKNSSIFMIDKGFLNFNFSDERIASEVNSYFAEKLKDASYKPESISISKELLQIIVLNNRMDLLDNVAYISGMDLKTALEIKDYFVNNNKEISPIFHEYLKECNLPLEILDIHALIREMLGSKKISFELLINKLKNSDSLIKEDPFWSKILSSLEEKEREIIADILLDKHCYIGVIPSLNINETNVEKYVNKFIQIIDADDIIEDFTDEYKTNSNYQILLSKPNVVEALIKQNKFSIVLCSPILNNYVSNIIEMIRSNPERFREANFSDYELEKYPEIYSELIKIGNCSLYDSFNCSKDLKDYFKEQVINGNFKKIPRALLNDNDFINLMIKEGHIDTIFLTTNMLRKDGLYEFDLESTKIILDKCENDLDFAIDFLMRNTVSVIKNQELLIYFLQCNFVFVEYLLEKMNHLEEDLSIYSKEVLEVLKNYLIKKYQLNEEHFTILANNFGPLIVRYVDNENIKEVINSNDETFNKIIGLFPKLEFKMADVEKIYDALKQYEFSKINVNDIEIFARINHSLNDRNTEYLKDLETLATIFVNEEEANKFYKKFITAYPELLDSCKENPKSFLLNIIKYIESGSLEEKDYYINVLHFITDYYIANKREQYRLTYDMNEALNLPYILDEKDSIKQFIKLCALRIHKNLIVLEMMERGIDETLANDCIDYYSFDKRDFSDDRVVEIQKHIKLMINLANKIIKITGISPYFLDSLDNEGKIRRKYYVEANADNLYAILMNLRIDVLENTILKPENNATYEALLTYIYKYKLHLLPDYFKKLLASENIDISLEVSDVASFISYFSEISETERKRLDSLGRNSEDLNLGIISIMKYAEAYSAMSSVYSQILGMEDFRLLKSNPKPNAAPYKTKGDTRLHEGVLKTLENFKRSEVTVPTFNEVLTLPNGKKMQVVVGNFSHPANLTMGERTGSCMRIGGLGETLFDFVLNDKNGFNIRLVDPETQEFISRVSGFRNGNSVFLNELRFSCNLEKYSNKDVVDFCTQAAEIMVEKSKDSLKPLDNVFLHNAYATVGLGLSEVSFGISDCKEGLSKFYSDIKDRGIVLATTNKPFVPIDFDKTNIPAYPVAREEVYSHEDCNKLRMAINRVHSINLALQGFNYEFIEPLKFANGIIFGFANQDWYIYLDENGDIHEELINIDSRANAELTVARDAIMRLKTNLQLDSGRK